MFLEVLATAGDCGDLSTPRSSGLEWSYSYTLFILFYYFFKIFVTSAAGIRQTRGRYDPYQLFKNGTHKNDTLTTVSTVHAVFRLYFASSITKHRAWSAFVTRTPRCLPSAVVNSVYPGKVDCCGKEFIKLRYRNNWIKKRIFDQYKTRHNDI